MSNGKFIVIDGIDGCGKSTMVNLMADKLSKNGKVVSTAEPSQGPIGKVLRDFLKNKKISGEIDALLFAADRLWHVDNVIKPALEENTTVISDRYVGSSLAYQSAQKGCKNGEIDDWVRELNKFVIKPDLYIVLDIAPEDSLKRRDNFDEKFENIKFLTEVRKIFLNIEEMQKYAKKYVVIPSTTMEETVERIYEEISKL